MIRTASMDWVACATRMAAISWVNIFGDFAPKVPSQRTLCVRLAGIQRARRATCRLCTVQRAEGRRNRGHCPAAESLFVSEQSKMGTKGVSTSAVIWIEAAFRLVGLSVDTFRARLHACRTNHRMMPRPSQGLRPSNTKAKIHPGKSHVTWVLVLS